MEDDDEFDPHAEKTLFNIKHSSIKDIRELSPQILSLRIMHSPELIQMNGIEQFKLLRHLNLSQNSIMQMNLKGLSKLETLNLQSNRIKIISCEGLISLKSLNLSYNLIESLAPLQIFAQHGYQLRVLDLRSNSIADLNELKHLQGTPLQEVHFNSDRRKNPICNNLSLYYKMILKCLPKITQVDKVPKTELSENDPDAQNHATFKLKNNKDEQNIEKEAQTRLEILQLQQKVKDLTQQHKDIIYKFECNEKYWSNKCSNLEREIVEQNKFNQELNQENKRFRREIEQLNEQTEYDRQTQKDLVNKKERKDELITQLQNKVSELLQLNGQLSKENQILIEQQNQLKIKEQEKELKNTELKIQLKEVEKQLSEFHKNAVEQASQTLSRQEQLQQKSEQVNAENRQLYQENAQLKRRIQELLEICREWEVKFENSLKEQEQNGQLQQQQVIHEFEQKLQAQQNSYEQQLQELETESKQMQDHLENEFRNLFQENLDKYKQLKLSFDEKCRIENDQKEEIRLYQNRIIEQDSLIKELQTALIRLKREVQEFCSEKDLSKKEHQIIQSGLSKDINILQDQLTEAQSRLQQIERELRLKIDEIQSLNQENERMRIQNKQKLQNEQMLEELQTNLTIKNKMLDDKNDTIDELKQQLNQIKNQEGSASEDYAKLQKRYDRQSQVIDELENQLQQVQDEYDQKCKDLKDKKQLISMFEKEIEEIEVKQDREINGLKQEIQEKDVQLQDLVKLVQDAKEEILRKDDKIRELMNQYQGLERQLQVIDQQNDQSIKQKDRQIIDLRSQLFNVQEELNQTVQENKQLKTKARENLQNLHKLFQQ